MGHYTLFDNRLKRIFTGEKAPDLVQVIIDRETAIRWLYQIAATLQYPDDKQPLIFVMFGELKVEEDDPYGAPALQPAGDSETEE